MTKYISNKTICEIKRKLRQTKIRHLLEKDQATTSIYLPNSFSPRDDNDEEATVVCESLATNNSVHSLILYSNSIGNVCAKVLADTLHTNLTLRKIDLQNNCIGFDGALALAQALVTHNRSVQDLGLYSNRIGDEGAEAIGEMLAVNTSLIRITLGKNSIGDIGAKAIGKGLMTNSTLSHLCLGYNHIEDKGAIALAFALGSGISAIKLLLLSQNEIRNDGGKALANSLSKNNSLKCLYLDSNLVGDEAVYAFTKNLKNNATLETLVFGPSFQIRPTSTSTLAEVHFFSKNINSISFGNTVCRGNKGHVHYNWKIAAMKKDKDGRLPLHVAIEKGLYWEGGIKEIAEANYDAVSEVDEVTGLYPFMLAAVGRRALPGIIFRLLMMNPSLVKSACNLSS